MRAYIIKGEKKIEPFNEYPRDCLINNGNVKHAKDFLKEGG